MFNNPGSSIQSVSKAIFCIIVFSGTAIVAFFVAISAIPVWLGILIILLIIFVAWLSVLVTYAFGVVTENIEEQTRLLQKIYEKTGRNAPGESSRFAAPAQPPVSSVNASVNQQPQTGSPAGVRESSAEMHDIPAENPVYAYTGNLVACVHCGHMNNNRRYMCEKCGKRIRETSEMIHSAAAQAESTVSPDLSEQAAIPQETTVSGTISPSKQRFCANCGTKMEEDEIFCPQCGTRRIVK